MINAIDVKCPDCGMNPGIWCVYIQPRVPRTGSSEWMYERAGLPTKRLHGKRGTKAYWMDRDLKRKAADADYAAQNSASPERAAILRANAQAVADEQHGLILWLRQHAGILL